MKVEKLKEKARRHELREEWQKAFDLYRTAIQQQDEDEPPDITLFNRLGDIQTRLGQINGAVEQYEKAIDLYLDAELPNNAIAICKKVIRNLPDRNIFFLRMGQIRAAQGFLTDARQNFLAFAERTTAAGDIESALNALVEFVEISPEDVEIRLGLASQLESHERVPEAIEQYREAYSYLIISEQDEEAQSVSEKLRELDPEGVLPDPDDLRADAEAVETGELILESTSLGGLELGGLELGGLELGGLDSAEERPAEFPGMEGEPGQEAEEVQEEDEGGIQDEEVVGDEEVKDPGAMSEAGLLGAFGFGEETAEDPAEEEEEAEALPTFGVQDEREEDDSEALPTFGFDEEPDEEDVPPLPTLDFEEEEDVPPLPTFDLEEEDVPPLPTFDFEGEEEEGEVEAPEEVPDSLLEAAFEDRAFETAVEDDVPDVEPGEVEPDEEVPEPSPDDHEAAAERGDLDGAIEIVQGLIREDPDNLDHHQRKVEYAFRKGDDSGLASAYMGLAGCLGRTGVPLKAKAVYQQILSLSPGHEGAQEAIQELEGVSGVRPPAQVASSEEYVDLGAMILGEEAEKTTRWKVSTEAPSGDEAADFAKMLGQFKEKVSEHLEADDVSAHHDLGTAYMEMGLFDEAISEFQMALRASPDHLPTHEVLGRCWMEMGKADMAIRSLDRALQVSFEIEDELIGIYYLMGRAQEDAGDVSAAVEFYEKVFSLDINFEDVTERLRALR